MFLNQIQATRRFLSHLTKFDPELNPEDPKNQCYEFCFGSRSELAIGMEYFGTNKYRYTILGYAAIYIIIIFMHLLILFYLNE